MIKATELRIGNWIKRDENEYEQVDGQFLSRDMTMSGISEVEGVDLTPEILEKAGFIKIEGKQGVYQTVEGQYQIAFFEGRNAVFYIRYDEFRGYCYLNGLLFYVHQLQNLYFALSGEELTITL